MQAVILAGGLGTRIREISKDNPKPMIQVCGKPFLEYQLHYLRKNGIRNILLCVGYKKDKIKSYFGNGKDYDLNISYSEEDEPLGTGGALKNAKDKLQETFIMMNGDTIFFVNIPSLLDYHSMARAGATIALARVTDSSRFGSVITDVNNQVKEFQEKHAQSGSNAINGGVYVFQKEAVEWSSLPRVFSLESLLLPTLVREGKVFGYSDSSYFIDIGTIDGYRKFEEDVCNAKLDI